MKKRKKRVKMNGLERLRKGLPSQVTERDFFEKKRKKERKRGREEELPAC